MLAGRGGGGSRGPCLAGGLLGAMSISRGAAEVVTCSGGMLHGFSICASRHRGSHSMRTQWVRLTPNVLCICVKCVAVCEHRLHGLARVQLCTLRGIMRVFYVIAMPFACAAACPRPRYRDCRRRRAAPAPLRPYRRHGRRDRRRRAGPRARPGAGAAASEYNA